MSTETVESSIPQGSEYHYYRSKDRKPLGSLPTEDVESITAVIKKILKSVEAQKTLPILIDGEGSLDERSWETSLAPPPEISSSTLMKYSKEVDKYDWKELPVNSKILEEYTSAPADSSYKKHRLLEIILTAVHHLAIDLYSVHHPPPKSNTTDLLPPPPYPVIAHTQYYASKPWKGIYDLKAIGFWAETQLFGGVAYFDRSHVPVSAEDAGSYDGVWLHGLPNAYTDSLWKVPDEVVAAALDEASLPFDIENAQHPPLLTLQEGQEKHSIFREPHLANHGTYTGDESEDVGMTAEEYEEWTKSRTTA
ncbi:hypothetical protein TWF970_000922 [Orbilia oligospora]|uniref:Uncharacterized protein n=1 Tax=Orbilia oligospora TaxID=2813651 RepID=A0A7C8VCG6_ORBOL|nr:hypothetical protein TWF970_000922 [Orbilia oligospora]